MSIRLDYRNPKNQRNRFPQFPEKGRKSKLTSSLKDNGQICQFLIPDKNTWTQPRPSTIGLPSGTKNVHLLRGEDVQLFMETEIKYKCFRFSHMYKSKAEYIRKTLMKIAVFGNFVQEVFQLENQED